MSVLHPLSPVLRVGWQEGLVELWFGHTLLRFAGFEQQQKELLPSVVDLPRIYASFCGFLCQANLRYIGPWMGFSRTDF